MQVSQTLDQAVQPELRSPALPFRGDTILGVCEGLAEDFGFNPLWLRVALAAGLLWNPVAIVGIYFGLAVIVLLSRLIFPARKIVTTAAVEPSARPDPIAIETSEDREPELIAA